MGDGSGAEGLILGTRRTVCKSDQSGLPFSFRKRNERATGLGPRRARTASAAAAPTGDLQLGKSRRRVSSNRLLAGIRVGEFIQLLHDRIRCLENDADGTG